MYAPTEAEESIGPPFIIDGRNVHIKVLAISSAHPASRVNYAWPTP